MKLNDKIAKGLKKAYRQVPSTSEARRGLYLEIFIDISTDEVLTHLHCDFSHCSRVVYDDPDILGIGFFAGRAEGFSGFLALVEERYDRELEGRKIWADMISGRD